jgi:hypothetical protein
MRHPTSSKQQRLQQVLRGRFSETESKHVPKLLTLTRRGTPSGSFGHVVRLVDMQALVIRLNSGVQVIEEKVRRNQSFLNAAGAFEETPPGRQRPQDGLRRS